MRKLQVLGIPRSGTTYLFKAIYHQIAQPFDNILNESFHPNNKHYRSFNSDEVSGAIDRALQSWCNPDQSAVTKTHPAHLNYLKTANLLDKFKSIEPYTIAIIRKSVVDTAISNARSTQTGEWISYNIQEPILIDTGLFEKSLKASSRNLTDLVENKWALVYDEVVYYEDLTGEPEVDVTKFKIYDSVNFVKRSNLKLNVKRFPDKRLSITNYNELVDIAVDFYAKLNHPQIEFDGEAVKVNLA